MHVSLLQGRNLITLLTLTLKTACLHVCVVQLSRAKQGATQHSESSSLP